jgi:pyruvate, orthophosphate dikinase
MRAMEEGTGKTYGGTDNPLLVAVRSGAKFSMPGMMDTVFNVGMNDEVAAAMIDRTGDERFVLDSHRRLVQMFATVVLGMDGEPFEEILRRAPQRARRHQRRRPAARGAAGHGRRLPRPRRRPLATPFPEDPYDQLRLATEAVFHSWNSRRAFDYRRAAKIADDLGTAVNVVAMVFGNTGTELGHRRAHVAQPDQRRARARGRLPAQRPGRGRRRRQPRDQADRAAGRRTCRRGRGAGGHRPAPRGHYREMQDMEFTVEDGTLWLLQTRTGKRTAQAAVRIAVDMATRS